MAMRSTQQQQRQPQSAKQTNINYKEKNINTKERRRHTTTNCSNGGHSGDDDTVIGCNTNNSSNSSSSSNNMMILSNNNTTNDNNKMYYSILNQEKEGGENEKKRVGTVDVASDYDNDHDDEASLAEFTKMENLVHRNNNVAASVMIVAPSTNGDSGATATQEFGCSRNRGIGGQFNSDGDNTSSVAAVDAGDAAGDDGDKISAPLKETTNYGVGSESIAERGEGERGGDALLHYHATNDNYKGGDEQGGGNTNQNATHRNEVKMNTALSRVDSKHGGLDAATASEPSNNAIVNSSSTTSCSGETRDEQQNDDKSKQSNNSEEQQPQPKDHYQLTTEDSREQQQHETPTTKDQQQWKEQPQPVQHSSLSFNQTLKSAFESHHKSYTLTSQSHRHHNTNDSSSSLSKQQRTQSLSTVIMPPPFLSHEEECTIKTALAFVMAKARIAGNNKKKKKSNMKDEEDRTKNVGSGGLGTVPFRGIEERDCEGLLGGAGSTNGMVSTTRMNENGQRRGSIIGHHQRGGILQNNNRFSSVISTGQTNDTRVEEGRPSALVGGLLAMPPQRRRRHTPDTNIASALLSSSGKSSLILERKLEHVRDVLQLAVSTVLPLYRCALEPSIEGEDVVRTGESRTSMSSNENEQDDDDDATTMGGSDQGVDKKKGGSDNGGNVSRIRNGKKPCAVYDFEAAVQPSNPRGSSNHATSFDGLCQHAIMRLSTLIREEDVRIQRSGNKRGISRGAKSSSKDDASELKKTNPHDGGHGNEDDNHGEDGSNANGSPTVVTDKSRDESSTAHHSRQPPQQQTKQGSRSSQDTPVRDAIIKILYNDLIGNTIIQGNSSSASSSRLNSYNNRECSEHRIEKIMAICHVLHRVLFLDRSNCLGGEIVKMICSILNDLYSNQYSGKMGNCQEATTLDNRATENDGDSESNNSVSNNGSNGSSNSTNNEKARKSKDKRQVVPARWGLAQNSVSGSYIHDRHDRRCQAVDSILSQRSMPSSRAKRGHHSIYSRGEVGNNDTIEKKSLPLPRIGDVLAVNLLRLLEGSAAIRIHHAQQRASSVPTVSSSRNSSLQHNREYMLDKVSSMAATRLLSEIRSTIAKNDDELLVPLSVEDAAAYYCNEKSRSSSRSSMMHTKRNDTCLRLLPGAKIMLRLHLFDLMSKLALYEQQ